MPFKSTWPVCSPAPTINKLGAAISTSAPKPACFLMAVKVPCSTKLSVAAMDNRPASMVCCACVLALKKLLASVVLYCANLKASAPERTIKPPVRAVCA